MLNDIHGKTHRHAPSKAGRRLWSQTRVLITHLYHVTSIDKTLLALLLAVPEKVKNTSCVTTAILTFPLLLVLSSLSAHQLPKGQRWHSFCVFIDAPLSFRIKPFIHSSKNLTVFIVINVSVYKYRVHIFESAYFPLSTARVWVCLRVASTFKATARWLFSKLWVYPRKCALAMVIYIHNL